jgi:hypothetical protein
MHRGEHLRVLAHAEIVVGAPDGDLPRLAGIVADGARKAAGLTLDIGEDAVAPLAPKPVELRAEEWIINKKWMQTNLRVLNRVKN